MYLSRSEEVRGANEHIAERAVQLRFVSRVPMLCECSDPDCHTIILIGLADWKELQGTGFLTAPGHTVEHATPGRQGDVYWLQQPTTTPRSNEH